MKRLTALLTLSITLCISLPAVCEETAPEQTATNEAELSRGLRLKPNAKWHLLGHGLALPAYFFLQTTFHESSHALGAVASGTRVTEFRPYPHMMDGRFVFGSMAASGRISKGQEIGLLLAPDLFDVTLFTASDLLLTYAVDDDSALAPFLLVGGMAAPLVDFLVSVNGPSRSNDTSRLGQLVGMPKWSIMLIGDAMAAVAIWRIVHHSYGIFFVRGDAKYTGSVDTTPSLTVSPVFVSRGLGLALAGRF